MELPNRILFVCHDGDLYGSQQSLNLLVKMLPKEAYRCFVTIARPGPLEKLLEQYPNTTVLRHRRLQWVKHDPRSWMQRAGDVLILLLTALPRTWDLFNTIRREKINVVHTNSTVSPEGAVAATLAGIPHVWHIRELFMEKSPKFHLVLGRKITRWLINRYSDEVICISKAVCAQFGPYLDEEPDKYHVVYNALEIPEPSSPGDAGGDVGNSPASSTTADPQRVILRSLSLNALGIPETPRTFRLGYIGRLSEGKGFHELLEAVILLRKHGVPLALVVAGNFVDAAYEARINERIMEVGLGDIIRFLGYQRDLQPVYEVLDLLVVPSRNEPFGRVVIEAMVHGVPVIGADSGGIPEIIETGKTGLLYPPGDVYALAGMIEELFTAFWKLEAFRQNAGRMVRERFNIETQIRTLDECYRSVIVRHQL